MAVLVNNPTYYGICSDLRAIVKMAHDAGMLCLADEAHGTHFYFGGGLPVSAMAAGADMASVSMHKSGGSLTQSSLLLIGPNVHPGYVRQIINLTQTTSPAHQSGYLRRNAQRGWLPPPTWPSIRGVNAVGGSTPLARSCATATPFLTFDTTKLQRPHRWISALQALRCTTSCDEFDIQIEFGDIGNILAYLSIGDRPQEVERLVSALAEIKRRYQTDGSGLLSQEYIALWPPARRRLSMPPKSLPGRLIMVCRVVMCYPPGIPILAPSEPTAEILNYIE